MALYRVAMVPPSLTCMFVQNALNQSANPICLLHVVQCCHHSAAQMNHSNIRGVNPLSMSHISQLIRRTEKSKSIVLAEIFQNIFVQVDKSFSVTLAGLWTSIKNPEELDMYHCGMDCLRAPTFK
jgi:hypothetical protein